MKEQKYPSRYIKKILFLVVVGL